MLQAAWNFNEQHPRTDDGATMHKGALRVAGCLIGGGLGMICAIWVIPTFETLGMYLLIGFCVHGLAAWVAFGSERISYIGLQIAMAFDLGVLMDYAPPTEIDPIRDRPWHSHRQHGFLAGLARRQPLDRTSKARRISSSDRPPSQNSRWDQVNFRTGKPRAGNRVTSR
jgi:hypothetical protein